MKEKIYYILMILTLLGAGWAVYSGKNHQQEQPLGANYSDGQWFVVSDFSGGYQTKYDPEKIQDGANPQGQNTTSNDGDRISIRNLGYELFPAGTASSSTQAITTLHTFHKRSGENVLIRTYGSVIEYFEEGNGEWTTLMTGLTPNRKFGFADFNVNPDLHSFVYFGNGVDNFLRWDGAHTLLTQTAEVGTTTIWVEDTSDFMMGEEVDQRIIMCGVVYTYDSDDTTQTSFKLLNAVTKECAAGKGVAQAVQSFSTSTHPVGNIYLAANNRLFIAGIASTTQAVYFSRYGDPTDFVGADLVTDSTADAPGIFNLGEGGGAVTGLALEENSIYIFKRNIIYKATLSDSFYTLDPLKPFDGRSQTLGLAYRGGVFAGNNGLFFVTPDKQILYLTRVAQIDYPQIVPISDIIKPTLEEADFSDITGVVFRNKAYFSFKDDTQPAFNNVVFVWDIVNKKWDSPIVGWNAADWAIYDDGDGEELYFGSANSPNVYKVTDTPQDDVYAVTANWRSKQFTFGYPQFLKQITDVYVEGYINDNTSLTISLLLDEDGYTQIYSTTLSGTESDYIYNSTEYNSFGLTAFGTKRFGSNEDYGGKKKFRVYLTKNFRPVSFYNAQIEFASDGENQQWEITSFGFKWRLDTQRRKTKLLRSFQ